ncbi:MAG: LysE family transporter [Chryseolinea sp.]
MEVILNGIVSGIILTFLIGPVFFTIIQTSIEHGFSSGVFVAVGVCVSDSMYILISFLGLIQFMDTPNFRHYMSYFGGTILMGFGLYYLLVKSRKLTHFKREEGYTGSWIKLAGKGFIINALSPMVLFFWIATVGVATTRFGYTSTSKAFVYFASIVCTVFMTDVIKAKLADKLRVLITPMVVKIMNIVLGIVLMAFASRLIFFPDAIPH